MKRKFFVRNFMFGALPAIVVAVFLGAMALYQTFDRTREEILKTQAQTLNQMKDSMDVMFSDADAQSLNYSAYPYITGRLKELLQNGYQDMEHVDINNMLKPFLDSFVNTKPYLHSVYLYLDNPSGNFFASGVGLANAANHRDTEWMEEINDPRETRIQWIQARTTSTYQKSAYDTRVLTLYKRIYYTGHYSPEGTLLLNVKMDYLEKMMKSGLAFEGQSLFITNRDEILVQVGEGYCWTELSDSDKNRYYIEEKESPGYDLKLVSMVPKSAVYHNASGMIVLVTAAIFLSLFLGLCTAWMTTSHNARSVHQMVGIFEAAENGEQLPEISPRANDAYGYIMQNVVKNFLEKNYLQMQLAEKKYKLDSMYFSFLQSQLNPHFLFNTLKNIFWKTVRLTGGQNDASRMIDLLTVLLHYALVNPDKFVTVSEEVKMTGCYLEIQQLRFNSGINVTWDCDSGVEEERIIKFILQPLVENSISHGLEGRQEKGRLTITVKRMGEKLFICVADNGSGFTAERLAEIRKRLAEEEPPVKGIGLYNLNKRLILTYGQDAALQIESEMERGTNIFFYIPARDKK